DLLHNIYLGIIEHMMDWIQGFLTHHNRLVAFDFIWKRLPPYPSFKPPGRAYRSITQWTGKELRDVGKVILASFAAALRRNSDQERPSGDQIQEFNQAILCIRYLSDFCLMAQYKIHTGKTIGYMNYYLQSFHRYKDQLVKEILEEKSHFNFPKIHLISHFSDQISNYGSLSQYSTEICESMHKELKDAYHRSNK
ncbi:hypothetical protein BDZ91DRAFT_642868, partial [Kalaharituber pfeilii]